MDAETCGLKAALAHDNVSLETGARVMRLETDAAGKRIEAVVYEKDGATHRLNPRFVALAAGAVNSALLLLASANAAMPAGLANRTDQVGRHFMNHNSSAALAIDPFTPNDAIYQKTIGVNDFYLDDGAAAAARQRPVARQDLGRDPQIAIAPRARGGARADGAPRRRFLSDERRPALARQSREAGRVARRARLAPLQYGGAKRPRRADAGGSARDEAVLRRHIGGAPVEHDARPVSLTRLWARAGLRSSDRNRRRGAPSARAPPRARGAIPIEDRARDLAEQLDVPSGGPPRPSSR